MPAAYAHLTLVNELNSPNELAKFSRISNTVKIALGKYLAYVELGAVSPDYPYLHLGSEGSKKWADLMHYTHTGPLILALASEISGIDDKSKKEKCLAWLFGFAAHVGMDMTVHPVVEMKVGSYAENSNEHRICEMNQDVYIYKRLTLGDIGLGEHLDSGIKRCGDGGLDKDIASVWAAGLSRVYSGEFTKNRPNFDAWHSGFGSIVDNIAEEGNRLLPLARHVAFDAGIMYGSPGDENLEYIENLDTPRGKMHYDEVFDFAKLKVGHLWETLSGVCCDAKDESGFFTEWNLDTGRDENDALVMWG